MQSLSREHDPPGVERHVDPYPLFRASKYHCCRGLQPDRRRPPEGGNRGRHAVVALPLLSLFIDIKSAAMLLSMPLIFSNLPQALEGGKTGRCLMQLMPVILGMIPGLFLGVRVLLALDANVARIIAGLVLMGVAGVTLLAPKLQVQSCLVL
ncbi:MAG TPA: sulfite exporter TauE/SafE family protein, partial [Chthoniobacterales bacterium]